MYSSNTFASQSDMRQRINIGGLRQLSNQRQASMPQLPSRQVMDMSQLPIQNSSGAHGGFLYPAVSQQQPFLPSPSVTADNGYSTGFVPNQQHFYNQGRSQPVYSPGVAATNGLSAGVFPYQHQHLYTPGRSQSANSPGVAATNCFSPGAFPHQQQFVPLAPAFGGQYSQEAFTAPAQDPRVAQDVASTFAPPLQQVQQQQQQHQEQQQEPERDIFEFVDLTRDDEEEEEVQTAAPVAPDVPAPVPAAEETEAGLPTPKATPPAPEAHSHLRERVNHLELTIHECDYPCAFRLLRSFKYMNMKQQHKYCLLFWPSNEAAREDLISTAELSLDFSDIYYRRLFWHAKETEIMSEEQRKAFNAKKDADCAEMARTCRAKLQDRRDEEDLSQLHQVLTNTKGKKKNKAMKAAQLELYKEEDERVQEEKRGRWARLNGKQASDQPAVAKRKRVDEEPAPAPAPKKRGRPPKVRAVEEQGVVKEKKKRGRPRKVPVVQEPTPDHTTDEAEDDGALEAALRAGLSEPVVEEEQVDGAFEAALEAEFLASFEDDDVGVVNEGAAVETPCQLQGHEQESVVVPAALEDMPAAFAEETPAPGSAAEVDSLPQEQRQEDEGCDEDSLFGDDPMAGGDIAMENNDDDMDSLFDDSDSVVVDDAAVVVSPPQKEAYEERLDADDLLADYHAFDSGDLGMFELENLLNTDAANDIGAMLDSIL